MAAVAISLAVGAAAGWLGSKLVKKSGKGDSDFEMWPQLAKGKHEVCSIGLCKVLLMDDTNYPCWLVLVPAKNKLKEVSDLPPNEQQVMWKEVQFCANILQASFPNDKMNVAAIGNICPQLHIHVTCRLKGDVSWPNPCYGAAPAKPYTPEKLQEMLTTLRSALLA